MEDIPSFLEDLKTALEEPVRVFVETAVRMTFFWSSRRRHTRLTCDWSADVCSSDLARPPAARTGIRNRMPHPIRRARRVDVPDAEHRQRSEERRVGKECRSRWSP